MLSNIFFRTRYFFDIIFRCFTTYSTQKNIHYLQGTINCELPKLGCFVTENQPKYSFFGYYEKNINFTISIENSYESSCQCGHFEPTMNFLYKK